MDLLSRKYALALIALVGNHGRLRYGEIEDHVHGISPKTLSDRLTELTEAGILDREDHGGFPPHVEYEVTDDGREVRKAIKPLMAWVARRSGEG